MKPRSQAADPAAFRVTVDALSLPHVVVVDSHDGEFLGSRNEAALLVKLRAASSAKINGAGGQGVSARERVPLNVGAVDLYRRIEHDVRNWCEREELNVVGLPLENQLRRWAVSYETAYTGRKVSAGGFRARTAQLVDMANQIRDLLDPPYRFPLTSPCPLCGQEWVDTVAVDDPSERVRMRALTVTERQPVEHSSVLCMACRVVWHGVSEARLLRQAIDEVSGA